MTKSRNEAQMEAFILQFRDKDGNYLIDNPPILIEDNQIVFKKHLKKMQPGDIKVFEQIEIRSLPMHLMDWRINTSAYFASFAEKRDLTCEQKQSIYPLIKNSQFAAALRYDFVVCYKTKNGSFEIVPIEINGPQHYQGMGHSLARQITYDIAKSVASEKLGLELIEIDASCGIDICGYSMVEKILQKYGAKKI